MDLKRAGIAGLAMGAWGLSVAGCAGSSSGSLDASAGGTGSSSGGQGATGSSSGGSSGSPSGASSGSSSGAPGSSSSSSSGGSSSSSSGGAPDASPAGDDGGSSPADGGWSHAVDGGPPWSGPSVAGTVTVDRATTVGRLVPGFAGFSYEKSHLTDAFFTANNAALIAMFRLLSPGILRVGGSSVEKTTWQAGAMPVGGGTVSPNVGTADVDALAAFLTATGWKVLYGVNLKTSTPAAAAAEATYAANTLAASLYGFEIGNEPSTYGSYASIKPRWDSFANAIKTAVPNVQLAGPAVYGNLAGWAVPFAHDEASQIVLLTQHYYISSRTAPSATMATMLGPDTKLASEAQTLSTATTSNHIRDSYRLGECNSFFGHGAPGVSDTLGAALWSIDFMFNSALHGASGVNFHGGGPNQDGAPGFVYTPIDEANSVVTAAKPLLYGMLLVSLAGTGSLYATTAQAGSLNFTGYAVGRAAGGASIVLVNKDATSGVQASVDVGATVASASAVYLLGSALTATMGVTLAGASVAPTGAWTRAPPFALAVAGRIVSVTVPAASAVLVQAQ
jgi:hypothetical protein